MRLRFELLPLRGYSADPQSTRPNQRSARQTTEAVPVSTAVVVDKPMRLLVSQTLTLYVTPVFYICVERISERLRSGAFVPDRGQVYDHFNRLLHVLHRHPLEP